jgi:hypothetical protein
MVGFSMVEQAHPGLSLKLGGVIPGLPGAILSVVGDVLVNIEAPVVTSSTSRSAGSVLRRCL